MLCVVTKRMGQEKFGLDFNPKLETDFKIENCRYR